MTSQTPKKPKLKLIKREGKTSACPICSEPSASPHRPFCSRRCAQIDLGRWLGEEYSIASEDSVDTQSFDEMLEQADRDIPNS